MIQKNKKKIALICMLIVGIVKEIIGTEDKAVIEGTSSEQKEIDRIREAHEIKEEEEIDNYLALCSVINNELTEKIDRMLENERDYRVAKRKTMTVNCHASELNKTISRSFDQDKTIEVDVLTLDINGDLVDLSDLKALFSHVIGDVLNIVSLPTIDPTNYLKTAHIKTFNFPIAFKVVQRGGIVQDSLNYDIANYFYLQSIPLVQDGSSRSAPAITSIPENVQKEECQAKKERSMDEIIIPDIEPFRDRVNNLGNPIDLQHEHSKMMELYKDTNRKLSLGLKHAIQLNIAEQEEIITSCDPSLNTAIGDLFITPVEKESSAEILHTNTFIGSEQYKDSELEEFAFKNPIRIWKGRPEDDPQLGIPPQQQYFWQIYQKDSSFKEETHTKLYFLFEIRSNLEEFTVANIPINVDLRKKFQIDTIVTGIPKMNLIIVYGTDPAKCNIHPFTVIVKWLNMYGISPKEIVIILKDINGNKLSETYPEEYEHIQNVCPNISLAHTTITWQ
ncbi:hypothetical protein NEOKW01_0310 [Nematocida sp. AWRm80]|nr:hypothetical protein NEOKW01_0310 [Nematocida sp. AWRm80]